MFESKRLTQYIDISLLRFFTELNMLLNMNTRNYNPIKNELKEYNKIEILIRKNKTKQSKENDDDDGKQKNENFQYIKYRQETKRVMKEIPTFCIK